MSIRVPNNVVAGPVIQTVATVAPSAPVTGAFWYDTTASTLKVWNGSAWVVAVPGGSGVVATATPPLAITGANIALPPLTTVPVIGALELANTTGNLHHSGQGTVNLGANLRHDGTNWNRINTANPGYLWEANALGGLYGYSVAAGANPAAIAAFAQLENANGYPQLRGRANNLLLAGQGVQLYGNGYYAAAGVMRENTGLALYNDVLGASGRVSYSAPAGANPVAALTQYGSRDNTKLVQNTINLGVNPGLGASYNAIWSTGALQYAFAQYNDGTVTLLNAANGISLRVGNVEKLAVNSAGPTSVGNWTVLGDQLIYRPGAPGSAAIFLNNTSSRFLYYDGTTYYQFPGSPLLVNGVAVASSRDLKTDIADVAPGALALIGRLRPRQFAFKEQPKRLVRGFVLEEVEPLLPGTVGRSTGPRGEAVAGLDYNSIFTTAVAAIQELSAQVAALSARVAVLEGKPA